LKKWLQDEVFDHSTITYFIERIGREGFKELFDRFNQDLLRMGLLSPKMYADSTLVRANVSSQGLSPSGMTVDEFQDKAIQVNDLFMVKEVEDRADDAPCERVKYYQDRQGRYSCLTSDPFPHCRRPSNPPQRDANLFDLLLL